MGTVCTPEFTAMLCSDLVGVTVDILAPSLKSWTATSTAIGVGCDSSVNSFSLCDTILQKNKVMSQMK